MGTPTMTRLHPSLKLTVGAQYICFNKMDAENQWTEEFEDEVFRLPTVTNVSVSDNLDSYDAYASGDIYDSDAVVQTQEISETNLAFSDTLLAKMRGEEVDGGVIMGGGVSVRPYFAYGFVVERKNGDLDLRWYPKCKLTENTDETATSTDSHADQTDDVTIRAYAFDEDKHKNVRVITSETGFENVTEEKFFAKPVLTAAEAKALATASGS